MPGWILFAILTVAFITFGMIWPDRPGDKRFKDLFS